MCAANVLASGAAPNQITSVVERRVERIDEFLGDALANSSAEIALLGGVAADLARAELVLFRALQEVVSESERPRDNLDSLPAALEVILKVDRQIERCLRLRLDVARSGAVREAACGNDGIAE